MGERAVSGTLDQFHAVAVGIAHEAESGAALADAIWRLLWLDAALRELREHLVEVLDRDRDVVVARAELVGVDAVVVGQLQARPVAVEAHEDVDRLIADREASDLLHAEGLVERNRAVDVPDPVTGVDQLTHRRPPRPRSRGR